MATSAAGLVKPCCLLCREDLASIERRLALAEDEARQAKASTLEYADVAKIERERALAARAEAEKAGKNLQSARLVPTSVLRAY